MLYPQFSQSKKKKSQQHGLMDVLTGNIPSAPAPVSNPQPRYGLKQFTEEYNKAEQAKIDAPRLEAERKFQALQDEAQGTMREINAGIRSYWNRPLSEMNPREAVIDTLGGYELRTGAPLTSAEQQIVAKDFFDGLEGNDIFLTPEAKTKFGYFFASLVAKRGISYTLANLVEALDRLVTLGVFVEPRDLNGFTKLQSKPTPKPVAQPKPPTFDEVLDANSAESREGREILVKAVEKEHNKVAIPLFGEWVEHLSRDHKGFVLSQEDAEYILEVMFPKNNWSYTAKVSYDLARRAMIAQGRWPESMLTREELLSQEIENLPTNADYHQRQQLLQRLRHVQ